MKREISYEQVFEAAKTVAYKREYASRSIGFNPQIALLFDILKDLTKELELYPDPDGSLPPNCT